MVGYNAVWNEALVNLKKEVPDFNYRVFFQNSQPFRESDGTYYFQVNNEMEKNLMEKKWRPIVEEAIQAARVSLQLPDIPITIVYLVPEEAEQVRFPKPAAKHTERHRAEEHKPPRSRAETQPEPQMLPLNPNHTFDSFVVGDSNSMAHAAALAVAAQPGQAYNPLFLYGGAGLGKTHLMHAIGNELQLTHPELKIVYVTSETFTNELISMIRTASNAESRQAFRNKYRTADVLMIDDIQFIAGKETTQDEFFHTFNALHADGKQIVLSSDRPPGELSQLEDRMRTRFEWGLIADIQVPDYETRVAILMRKVAELPDMPPVDDAVFDYMARQPNENIRSLEGALKRVEAYSTLHKLDYVDQRVAEAALREIYHKNSHKTVSAKLVCDLVCEYYDITEEELLGTRRTKDIAFARQVAMYLIRDMTDMSLTKVAGYFRKKDHTTIMHAERTIRKAIEDSPEVKREVEDLSARLKNM